MRIAILWCSLVLTLTQFAYADPTISDIKVTPIRPWGMAIDFKVSGVTADCKDYVAYVYATNGEKTFEASTLSGDVGCFNGEHRVYWNVAKDDLTVTAENSTIAIRYDGPKYCVVDLSRGENASKYDVSYMNEKPVGGFNVDTYKTNKLILRRVGAGTFKMQGLATTTISRPFYIGVFEVTQRQYKLITGDDPSYQKGERFPVEGVSYLDIRGKEAGTGWPANNKVDAESVIGLLRKRTGLEFDLPTEAQWEYACRAGTTSKYNNGGNAESDLSRLGNWNNTDIAFSSHNLKVVGSYEPNMIGLYDMHGNVSEWCLDYFGGLNYGIDPVGPAYSSAAKERVYRGGSFYSGSGGCTSNSRGSKLPDNHAGFATFGDNGFRLIVQL